MGVLSEAVKTAATQFLCTKKAAAVGTIPADQTVLDPVAVVQEVLTREQHWGRGQSSQPGYEWR